MNGSTFCEIKYMKGYFCILFGLGLSVLRGGPKKSPRTFI